jgi:chromate reductase, NAD(P)H dehydrogenase (quinone)
MRLLEISGSLRRDSYNQALLDAAAAALPPDVEVFVWRGLGDIPAFDEDIEIVPEAVERLRCEISRADALLIATPEYNASVPGALKNALDWVSRPLDRTPLRNKPVAIVGASQGVFGGVWAQAELRKVLRTIGADVADRGFALPIAHEAFTTAGWLRDESLAADLHAVLLELVQRTARRAA